MTKILVITIIVLGGALTLATELWLSARDDLAKNQVKLDDANAETIKQKLQNTLLKLEAAKAIGQITVMAEERKNDAIRYQTELNRINSRLVSSKKAATEHPERYGAIATFRIRRGMRDICRSGEGSPDTCKIKSVRPAKASTSYPRKFDVIPGKQSSSKAIK